MSDKKELPDGVSMELHSVADLKHDPFQARKHTPRNIDLIENSLQKVGAGRSVWIDEDNTILAGNGTIEAAGNVGMERVLIVDAPADVIIARRTRGLTHEQKRYGALIDNRATELSAWDPQMMSMLVQSGIDVSDGWTPEEIAPIMHADWTPPSEEPLTEGMAPVRSDTSGMKFEAHVVKMMLDLADRLGTDSHGAVAFALEHALSCNLAASEIEEQRPHDEVEDVVEEEEPQA